MLPEPETIAMNTEREQIIAKIVQASGGQLVSRIRLQKVAYLLEELGEHSGFAYTYHHYGPYSRDLDNAVEDAKAFGLIEEDVKRRHSDGATYSIFRIPSKGDSSSCDKNEPSPYLESAKNKALVERFNNEQIVTLELAATAHWLFKYEKVADWETELKRRKGSKTEEGRLGKALELLRDLNLPPAVMQGA